MKIPDALKAVARYIKHLVIGETVVLDEAANVAVLKGGAHENVSAHCGAQIVLNPQRNPPKRACLFCRILCPVLGLIWPNHCLKSYAAERLIFASSKKLTGG